MLRFLVWCLIFCAGCSVGHRPQIPDAPPAFQVQYDPAPFSRLSDWTAYFTPDCKTVLLRTSLVDVATGKVHLIPGATLPTNPAALSPDGKFVAALVQGWRGYKQTEHWYGVALVDVATATTLHTIEIPDHTIGRFFFNVASNQLAAVSYDQIYLIDVVSGKLSKTLRGGNHRATAFSPEGTVYARMIGWFPPPPDGVLLEQKAEDLHVQVSLYRTATGELLRAFAPVRVRADEISYSADGRYILTDAHPVPLVFDVATGLPLKLPANEMQLDVRKPLLKSRYALMYEDRRNAFLDLRTGKLVPVIMPEEPTDLVHRHIRGIADDGTTILVEHHAQYSTGVSLHLGHLQSLLPKKQ